MTWLQEKSHKCLPLPIFPHTTFFFCLFSHQAFKYPFKNFVRISAGDKSRKISFMNKWMVSLRRELHMLLPYFFPSPSNSRFPDVVKAGLSRRTYVFSMNSVGRALLHSTAELLQAIPDQHTCTMCSRDYPASFLFSSPYLQQVSP